LALLAGTFATAIPTGQAQEPGAVGGHVKLISHVPGARQASAIYSPRGVPRHDPPPLPEIRNVVVYLKDAAFRGALPLTTSEMRQEHETFVPHVLAITRGSTVTFPNADPIFHNVFSLSRIATFDLGRYPEGHSRAETFSQAGLVKLYCRIHSQMSATILVLDHPYFATPNDDGTFRLPNVPPGQYTVVGWHERVGERTASIRVEAGKTAEIDLTLPVEDPR
jgi:plastocyanin